MEPFEWEGVRPPLLSIGREIKKPYHCASGNLISYNRALEVERPYYCTSRSYFSSARCWTPLVLDGGFQWTTGSKIPCGVWTWCIRFWCPTAFPLGHRWSPMEIPMLYWPSPAELGFTRDQSCLNGKRKKIIACLHRWLAFQARRPMVGFRIREMVSGCYGSLVLVFQVQIPEVNLKGPYTDSLTQLEVADPNQVNAPHLRSK